LAEWSSRFANLLEEAGVARGDRVAIMLEPSLAFYGAVFGTVKRGAVAVPLFTLFGPEGLALRVDDCRPRMLVVEHDAERWRAQFPEVTVIAVDALTDRLRAASARYVPATAPDDLALFQYTSGTTRALPEAVRHTHRSVVTLMVAALYGVGLRAGDRYFCPSSPAWGHGLWHGTVAPLALGFEGYEVGRGALGKPAPGWEVAVVGDEGPLPPGRLGEIAVRRRGEWFRVKDRGSVDADGYFFHAGRSDDVISSAGWTMSALEI